MERFKEGDVICIISEINKRWFTRIGQKTFGTHKGNLNLADLIGKEPGSSIKTSSGLTMFAFYPSLEEILLFYLKRSTQIIYPKDLAYIILKTGVKEGARIIECGTGSGAATLVLAHFVGDSGKIYSYENRPEFSAKAGKTIEEFGLEKRVEFKIRDAIGGFDEKEVDIAILDLKNPQDCLANAFNSLKNGGSFAVVVPTTNQVSAVLSILETLAAANVEVSEILLRKYKTNPERLRPNDIMTGHTAYLITGRKITFEKCLSQSLTEPSTGMQAVSD